MTKPHLQPNRPSRIGGQIIIEPDLMRDEIDRLFALLEASRMRVARIRMF
jgi:hypothetical protein